MFQTLPIANEGAWAYLGTEPEEYLGILEDVGQLVLDAHDNRHIAPDILDPWVFWQFSNSVLRQIPVHGSLCAGNWRLLASARRMADELKFDALAQAIFDSEQAVHKLDSAVLDAYDHGHDHPGLTPDLREKLAHLLDSRFHPLVHDAATPLETGDPTQPMESPLLHQLALWVAKHLPRVAVSGADGVGDAIDRGWGDVERNFPEIMRAKKIERLGDALVDLLELAGVADAHLRGKHPDTTGLGVGLTALVDSNAQTPLLWAQFADANVLINWADWCEIARMPADNSTVAKPGKPLLPIKKRPQFYADPKTMALTLPGLLRRLPKKLSYRS